MTRRFIHTSRIDSNNYGEFVFITVSRPNSQDRETITFWGHGFHEPRDRWIFDEWFYQCANQFPANMKLKAAREDVDDLLRERQEEIAPYVMQHEQSRRGQLFEYLAELSDDDAAFFEM